jgi:hypothetical protein
VLLVAALVLAGARAYGEPDDLVARPLVLAAGAVDLRLTVEIDVRRDMVARPLSFAPDAWWGIASRWTVGVIHSNASVDQIAAGATVCVRDSPTPTCSGLYRGGGVDLRFGALAGSFAVAPRARLLVRAIDPFKPATTLGALVRWTRGRFAITADPYLRVPLANAELGNRAALSLPIWVALQPARGWMITAHTGFDADLAVLADGGHGPLGLGVTARITAALDVSLEAGWARLFGPQYNPKEGAVLITVAWASSPH